MQSRFTILFQHADSIVGIKLYLRMVHWSESQRFILISRTDSFYASSVCYRSEGSAICFLAKHIVVTRTRMCTMHCIVRRISSTLYLNSFPISQIRSWASNSAV